MLTARAVLEVGNGHAFLQSLLNLTISGVRLANGSEQDLAVGKRTANTILSTSYHISRICKRRQSTTCTYNVLYLAILVLYKAFLPC